MTRLPPRTILAAAAAAVFLAMPRVGIAQQEHSGINFRSGSHFFAGFTASPPDQVIGVGVVYLIPRLPGWGLLVDARFPTNRPSQLLLDAESEPLDADIVQVIEQRTTWTSPSVAIVRGISPELALFVGAGPARGRNYRLTAWERAIVSDEPDQDMIIEFGRYWREHGGEDATESGVNVVGGALFRMGSRVAFQIGAQTAPGGFTVGGYLRLF